jgi:hypothetical protein
VRKNEFRTCLGVALGIVSSYGVTGSDPQVLVNAESLTTPAVSRVFSPLYLNSHLGLLRSEHCRVHTEQLTRAVARPASLWHQSET